MATSWSNLPVSWAEFERRASGRPAPTVQPDAPKPRTERLDYPGRRAKRRIAVHSTPPSEPVVPYAELHCHSNYSFLDGASSPEALVTQASTLGLSALAITDHDGFYGAPRFAEAAEACGLATVFGAELSLGLSGPSNGVPDPPGSHLLALACGTEGYRRLARAMTEANLSAGAEKGRPVYDLAALAAQADGHWVVLTGCRKGAVRQALTRGDDEARRELHRLVELFGDENVVVELTDHRLPADTRDNDRLADLASRFGLPIVATNAVHYASTDQFQLATALAAVRARRSLDELDGWLPSGPTARLRSGAEMAAAFARYPGAVTYSLAIAERAQFALRSANPGLPDQDVPPGHTPISWLRVLVDEGRERRYGDDPAAAQRLRDELSVIEAKGFAGYFLIVYDIAMFARTNGILYQGRGSAAASAVCYVLGITVVDPVFYRLPFERFLSALREEEPDIDVDFDSSRREEVIQYVYRRYGRRNAAQVANVVTYRPRNAIRDMARALGFSPGQQDAWAKQTERWGIEAEPSTDIPPQVIDLANQVMGFPRHLGIHSGGMVLTKQSVGEVCPIEPARMPDRTVLQWDKDDCAWMGLVKFDLLGLGMLAAVQHTFDMAATHLGERWTMDTLPRNEPGVYDMLCRADTIGVFQIESRAQIGTLPRLKPRSFYDLAVEIALIRPGPIQGGAVHPYIRRRTGAEPVTYPHPLLEPVLKRTLGVPLFQEQLMQMATTVGNCTAADADLLRRAMGSKRGVERIGALRDKLFEGMAANGISDEVAADIYTRIESFANFGFAESHALSFAVLVYASSWLKLHYPAAFLAALLRSQPMGFYSGATLTADARRHGVRVRSPDLAHSGVWAGLEPSGEAASGDDECLHDHTEEQIGAFCADAADRSGEHRRDRAWAVRLGLADIGAISSETAQRIVDERARAPFVSLADAARRLGLETDQWEALSLAGALDGLAGSRRGALWQVGEVGRLRPGQLAIDIGTQPPLLPEPTAAELLSHDLRATGISPEDHPISHHRARLNERGALSVRGVMECESGTRIEVGGIITHRQRPGTAGGVTFLNLEDETGLLNVVVSAGAWQRYRQVGRTAAAMIVRGMVERSEGVTNLYADRLQELSLGMPTAASRDFR